MSRSNGYPDQFGRRDPAAQPLPQPAQHPRAPQPTYPQHQNGLQDTSAPQRSQADAALSRLQEFGLVPPGRTSEPPAYRPPSDPRPLPADFHTHWNQHPQAPQPAQQQYAPTPASPYAYDPAPTAPAAYGSTPHGQGFERSAQQHSPQLSPQAVPRPVMPGPQQGFSPFPAQPGHQAQSGAAPIFGAPVHAPAQHVAPAAHQQVPPQNPRASWQQNDPAQLVRGNVMPPGPERDRDPYQNLAQRQAPRPAVPQSHVHQPTAYAQPVAPAPEPSFADWGRLHHAAGAHAAPAEPAHNTWDLGYNPQGGPQHGHPADPNLNNYEYAEASGGQLEAAHEDPYTEEYYEEQPVKRSRRPLFMTVGAVAVVGLAAFFVVPKYFGGAKPDKPAELKSASAPSKVKPASPDGKQFDYRDSKIMGRLGDGSSSSPASASADSSADTNGTRRVQTLTVGRDGSIAPPPVVSPPPASVASSEPVSVPGLTVVDGFGSARPSGVSAPSISPSGYTTTAGVSPTSSIGSSSDSAPATASAPKKLVVAPPPASAPAKPVMISKTSTQTAAAADVNDAYDAPPPRKQADKPKKVAAVASTESVVDSSAVASDGSAGYVAVLASVPRSDNSRMTALAQFANMQQQYGSVLENKTPDVREANLGAKGTYHRLLVGPPASREEASAVCSQLKSAGYKDCWVTAY